VLSELELEVLSLHLCADQAAGFLHARGRNRNLRLLDILDHVCESVESGTHHGIVVALAIAQLHSMVLKVPVAPLSIRCLTTDDLQHVRELLGHGDSFR
jgi:hypothetical protein